MNVSAIIVTRGDTGLGPVLSTINADEIIIRRGHGGCWERWEAAMTAKHDVVFVQDDDAVVDFEAVVAAYHPDYVTCNMPMDRRPEYRDGIALVGWGCVLNRTAVSKAFDRFFGKFAPDALFRRECDRVLTGLSPLRLIDVPFEHLQHAHGDDRMGRQPEHGDCMREIRRRIYAVRNQ